MLTDKNNLLHTVTIFIVPITQQARFPAHHFHQFFFRCCGIPQTCFFQFLLHTGLFKKERHVRVIAKVTYPLSTDNITAPFGSNKMVELMNIERRTTIVNKSTDAIFLHFTTFMMMVTMLIVLCVMSIPFMFFVVMVMSALFRLPFLLFC